MPFIRPLRRPLASAPLARMENRKEIARRKLGPHYIELRRFMSPTGKLIRDVQCLHCAAVVTDESVVDHLVSNHI